MEFTIRLGAQNVRLTFLLGSDTGKNRQPNGKKYKRWDNHEQKDAFFTVLEGETSSIHLSGSSLSDIYACKHSLRMVC
jgi:hypothetical protein